LLVLVDSFLLSGAVNMMAVLVPSGLILISMWAVCDALWNSLYTY
jgi:hypothetical protein